VTTKLAGSWGEAHAAAFLRKKNYQLISMGYRCRLGEIDIIARNRRYIIFVEVKTRKDKSHGEAREFVTQPKRRRIRITAELWLLQNETELQPRFDVIEIYAPQGVKTEHPEIIHLEDAF